MAHNFLNPSQQDLVRALREQNLNLQEREVQGKATALGLPYMNLHGFPMDLNVVGMFTEEEARNSSSVPFFREGRDLRIGTTEPKNALLKTKVEELGKKFQITLYYISPSSLNATLKLFAKISHPAARVAAKVEIDPKVDYVARVRDLVPAPEKVYPAATDIIADLMGAALMLDASDIHLEPEEHTSELQSP
jgi:type II secretory ATPase GspE/PulE/Tfp pilus assembly ATPase PilB-like protein